ncbi:MAG: hypothetical protein PUP46_00985 [Endozoicomonas sp. (ex Botrylloides leachii)]|nr:hypothetical protein [Endozoicomonas sp. (ex Botrylloides leachii)]
MKAIPLLFGCFMACFVTTAYSNSLNFNLVVELAEDTSLKKISIFPCKDPDSSTTSQLPIIDQQKVWIIYPEYHFCVPILNNYNIRLSPLKIGSTDALLYLTIQLCPNSENAQILTEIELTLCFSLLLGNLWHKKEYPFCQREYPEAFNGFKFKIKSMPLESVSASQQYNADQAETSDDSMDYSDAYTDNMYYNELILNQEEPSLHPVTVNYFGDKNTPKIDTTIPMHYYKQSIVEDAFKLTHAMANLEQPNQEAINSHSMASGQLATSQKSDFLCEQSNLEFPNTHRLITHLKPHTEGKPYKCDYPDCTHSFIYPSHKEEHILRHHTRDKPFKCKYANCKLSFCSNKELQSHVRTHKREMAYKCSYCDDYKSIHYTSMVRHIEKKHASKNHFQCKYCSISFSKCAEKRLHIYKDHNLKKLFPCQSCAKIFTTTRKWSKHSCYHRPLYQKRSIQQEM